MFPAASDGIVMGLPVENEIEKLNNFSGAHSIEDFWHCKIQ